MTTRCGIANTARNTAMGYRAMFATTSGSSNVAVGDSSLSTNTTGASNVAVGDSSLVGNTTGYRNVGVGGYNVLTANTTGWGNVALGYATLSQMSGGDRNIAIGDEAGYYVTGAGSRNILIGNRGAATDDKTIRIGDPSSFGQTRAFVAGITNATNVSGQPVVIDSNGQLAVGKISQLLRMTAIAAPPVTCSVTETGSVYVDDDTKELCFCDGTSWTGLKAGGACTSGATGFQ